METEVILEDVKTVEELDAQREAFLEKMRLEDNKYLLKRGQLVKEERERRHKEEQDWRDQLERDILHDYDLGPKEVAKMIVDRAWDEGHSYGYDEVKAKAESLALYTEKVVKITEEMCY
jgi:hypothetical protein